MCARLRERGIRARLARKHEEPQTQVEPVGRRRQELTELPLGRVQRGVGQVVDEGDGQAAH
jgi:hypothetical protein